MADMTNHDEVKEKREKKPPTAVATDFSHFKGKNMSSGAKMLNFEGKNNPCNSKFPLKSDHKIPTEITTTTTLPKLYENNIHISMRITAYLWK